MVRKSRERGRQESDSKHNAKAGAVKFNLEEELRKISESYGISVDEARERFNEYLDAVIPINTRKNKKDEKLQIWCLELVKKYLGREREERSDRGVEA